MSDAEIWKPVKGFEGLYEVSSLGRVRSMERRVKSKANSTRIVPAKIRKLQRTKKGMQVSLHRDGRLFCMSIPKIVMEAFTKKKPPGNAYVQHIDGDICNNALSNLRYRKAFYLPENPKARKLFFEYANKFVQAFIYTKNKHLNAGVADTEDFEQEALLRIWKDIDAYDEKIAFSTFCYTKCNDTYKAMYEKYSRIKSREIYAYEICASDPEPLYLIDTLVSNDNFYERIDDNA